MKRTGLIALIAVVLLIMFWPVTAVRLENTAKEDVSYIRRVFAEHTVGQTFTSEYDTDGVQLLVRSPQLQVVNILLHDETGTELSSVQAGIDDTDRWVPFKFNSGLAPGTHTITASAPGVAAQGQAVLLRFQIDSDRYEEGSMVVDGEDSYGDLAFRLEETVAPWHALTIWGQVTDSSLVRGSRNVAVAAVFIALALLPWSRLLRRPWLQVTLPIVAIFGLAVLIRLPYLNGIEGVFGGDAFNYLSKAQALLQGGDPFAADPRKGPLLSFLLLPGFLTIDPLLWSRALGVLAAAGTATVFPFIARSFKLPWIVALLGGLLVAVNPELIYEAPSGLANALFTFLIALAVFFYLRPTTRRTLIGLAVTVGLVALTRYEGVFVGAVLLPAIWWRERLPLRRIALIVVIAVVIAALPLSSWFWSGTSGVRTVDDLLGDEGLFIAASSELLQENLDRLHAYGRQMWIVMGEKGRANFSIPALAVGFLVGIALVTKVVGKTRPLRVAAALAMVAALLFFSVTKSSDAREYLVVLPLFLLGVGIAPLFRARRFDAIVLLTVVVAQLVVITLILPKSRYFLQLVPYAALLITYGMYLIFDTELPMRLRKFVPAVVPTIAMLGLLTGLVYLDGVPHITKRLEVYNGKASEVAVMVKAARFLRGESAIVGFRPREEQPAVIFVPAERRVDYHSVGLDIVIEELQWLRDKNIDLAVERDREPQWESRPFHPDVFAAYKVFETIHGDEEVRVYRVDHEALTQALK